MNELLFFSYFTHTRTRMHTHVHTHTHAHMHAVTHTGNGNINYLCMENNFQALKTASRTRRSSLHVKRSTRLCCVTLTTTSSLPTVRRPSSRWKPAWPSG